jgi:sialate O-acetylesterase
MQQTFLRLLLSLIIVSVSSAVYADVRLPAIIGDNMVLQQDTKVRIWGNANPGEQVVVTLQDKSSRTVADKQGRWEIWLPPLKAGGPLELSVKGNNALTIKNVLVGEVWVCSGQSNMEWPLINTIDGAETVAQAKYPEIRLFTVEKNTAASPLNDVEGHWVVTTPDDAAHFSAVGYFFGRELYQQLKVPIGLINTSWGGTPAEAWTSHEALLSSPELKPILDRYESSLHALPEAKEAYARMLAEWEEKNLYLDSGNKGESMGYAAPTFAATDWSSMDLPKQFEAAGLLIDGAVWFRKVLELPSSWAGKELVLNLPPIDDQDVTYFNGARIGSIGRETPNSYMVPRKYVVPGSLVQAGRNVIAVRVFDSAGEGGFSGGGAMSIGPTGGAESDAISLRGVWDYKVELALEPKYPDWGTRPEAVGVSNQNNPSVLYNAMIAPLVPFAVRGVIWYQGESNAGRAYQYRTLFPIMIRDWRKAWGSALPFYFVQLANWHASKPEPDESDWAELREAQMMTLREPHTGMAVTIDIGDENDIHPRNKLDVGRRLAAWALAGTYGQKVIPSGPLFDRYTIDGDKVRIHFKYGAGLKTIDGRPVKGFALAGEDRHFVWADARIEGDTVIVSSAKISKPVAVRYGWADNPIGNLYNGAGFPASPFRTDDWPGVTAAHR